MDIDAVLGELPAWKEFAQPRSKAAKTWALAFRGIASATNKRTAIASIIPMPSAVSDGMPIMEVRLPAAIKKKRPRRQLKRFPLNRSSK